MFIIDTDSGQTAAFMMLDMKAEMKKDPEYIAYMGGYYRHVWDEAALTVSRNWHYLAGVLGLPERIRPIRCAGNSGATALSVLSQVTRSTP